MAKFTFNVDRYTETLIVHYNNEDVMFEMYHVNEYMIKLLSNGELKKFVNYYINNVKHFISRIKKHIENREDFLKSLE